MMRPVAQYTDTSLASQSHYHICMQKGSYPRIELRACVHARTSAAIIFDMLAWGWGNKVTRPLPAYLPNTSPRGLKANGRRTGESLPRSTVVAWK